MVPPTTTTAPALTHAPILATRTSTLALEVYQVMDAATTLTVEDSSMSLF